MEKSPLFAVLVGAIVSVAVHRLFTTDWHIVLVIGCIYAATAYFYFSTDASLLSPGVSFENGKKAVGHGVGLFGLAMSPLAFGRYYTTADVDPVFLLWFIGVIAFLLLVSEEAWKNTANRGD